MSTHKVFVYGTLKRNEPNHNWLESSDTKGKATFLGVARTVQKYPLVIASRYNIPYVVAAEGVGENVEGEVYEVNDPMLGNLDILEDHPKYYERKIKQVKMVDANDTIDVWIYLLHKYKPHMLELPFLTTYKSQGDHGLKYMARYLRDKPGAEYWSDVKED